MIRGQTWKVDSSGADSRLDLFVLSQASSSTRSLVEDAVAQGLILVNGRKSAKGLRVHEGDEVRVEALYEKSDLAVTPDPGVALSVLHEDEALVVFDKPAGMPVHPLKPGEMGTLANGMVARYPELAGIGDDLLFPALVHRIDTDTSGLVIAARSAEAYAFLREEFRCRCVRKEYTALVHGVVKGGGRLEHLLAHRREEGHRMVAVEPGERAERLKAMRAVTEYTVKRSFAAHTLLDVVIQTGVTHQIRCQLEAAGWPIVGDTLYGGQDAGLGLSRQFLHASGLVLTHPNTRKDVRFESALPQDLLAVLEKI